MSVPAMTTLTWFWIGLHLLCMIARCSGQGFIPGCKVPEPGIQGFQCDFEVDDGKDSLDWPWHSAVEPDRLDPDVYLFGGIVELSNPMQGDITQGYEACKMIGGGLASQPLLKNFWNLFTGFPPSTAMHPWYTTLVYDGSYGPAFYEHESGQCNAGIFSGRSVGLTRTMPCDNKTAFFICARCRDGQTWNPSTELYSFSNLVSSVDNLRGKCMESCNSGSYFHRSGEGGACIACFPGEYMPNQNSAGMCNQCSAGKFNTIYGSTQDCTSCDRGTFQANQGQSACEDCPPGKYQDVQGAGACKECPIGKFSDAIAAQTSSVCTNCGKGKYSIDSTATSESSCVECSKGKYSTSEGASSEETCVKCPAGYYNEVSGATAFTFCIPCASGKYSPVQGAMYEANCTSCDMGFISAEGSNSADDCVIP